MPNIEIQLKMNLTKLFFVVVVLISVLSSFQAITLILQYFI